ncbi:hypothetical protein JHK82_030326 [Glycine max]|uniref:Uncharacterized protein n=2 Tax=Glycine subgen. Soja TaxID=1462606 RepID=K7LNH9_SOYBN|nr:hypothetical protein JHK85_030957 [Glycine max]KAG5123589.1 hypothetical protein JHK82_030326 [Glycine max]KAH1158022.1 hypothetical protein GYH30_030319 [Glycine max]KRH28754.1 hypothetical protein GLYMA_11G074000v4 [Glycine max]RZB78781.1 hypothetical protein D0Y65_029249 [Glycine soja]
MLKFMAKKSLHKSPVQRVTNPHILYFRFCVSLAMQTKLAIGWVEAVWFIARWCMQVITRKTCCNMQCN